MAEKIKKTRPELLRQRRQLGMFQRFLPTLVLKKQQIQSEILKVRGERLLLDRQMAEKIRLSDSWALLFSESLPGPLTRLVRVKNIQRGLRNVAGIKLPIVAGVEYEISDFSRLSTPPWVDAGLDFVKELLELREKVRILHEQEEILQKELRKVTQRVNLFEKVKIPEAKENIRLIRVNLAEEQTAAVGRSKIAKGKSKS
ncbi:MAG TPA: V-type ATP synthase subunit D [Candidatus Rifleibacterium sp.]|nr:V-type ATP synthase subunit D [Candidatus Rifleibacterium sp.]HPT45165.1 V-type ATP synthase subunit D [Candidatus Rifleibacterium sp.]